MNFDNLVVNHYTGPLQEETHYGPWGNTLTAISAKALNRQENKFRFNDGTELSNKEFADGSGLEWYETDFRSYDAQIGRFHQLDPLMELYEEWSPYSFALDNPISLNDPLGLASDDTTTLEEVVVVPIPRPKNVCYTCGLPKPDPSRAVGPNAQPSSIDNAGLPANSLPTLYPIKGGRPINEPEPLPLPLISANPILLTVIGVFLPLGGPHFPGNDETIYYRYPELYGTIDPNPRPNPNPEPDDPNKPPLYLLRFGTGPESVSKLNLDANRAFSHRLPFGVSTQLRFRISGTDKKHKSALLKEIMKYFAVKKTGHDVTHYTVILPNPVTQETANLFNSLFKNR